MQQMHANNTYLRPQHSLPFSRLGLGSLCISAYPLMSQLGVVWSSFDEHSSQPDEVKGDENSQCWTKERCWREGGW
jgi:hypothetical protein